MRTREEHLEWCKERAREYLDRGDLANAVASMGSDMDKHPETRMAGEKMGMLMYVAMIRLTEGDVQGVRDLVEGFR
jgi:hypothetical protein